MTGVVGTAATASTYAVLERLRTSAADKPGFTASGMSSATTGATTVTRSVLFSMVGVLVPLSVTTTWGFVSFTMTGVDAPSTAIDNALFSIVICEELVSTCAMTSSTAT